MSSLLSGINELRSLITTPRDPLYQHLSDLIAALEEVSVPNPSLTVPKAAPSPRVEFSKCKRKSRRKKDSKSSQQEINAGINLDPSSNHSPGNGGSESSADEIEKKKNLSPNATVEMSDSEDETVKRSSTSGIWLKPNLCHLSLDQRNFGVPVESDSFTETFTPARHHRRKRLIKRMAIDPTAVENDIGLGLGINQRRHSASMDMDVSNSVCGSPRYSSKKRRLRKTGSCHSESSMDCNTSLSSSESDGNNTSDAGRQADDEQSDWYFELPKLTNQQDECMGVPNIRKMLLHKAHQNGFDQLNGTVGGTSTIESSDTDMSQSSGCVRTSLKYSGKRLMNKSGPAMSSALNKRLVSFLRDGNETELQLGTLRKRERKEALRLASFYHLDVRCKTSKGVKTYTIIKTKYSLWP